MINLCRNFKSRFGWWVLLPYLLLAFGAPFLHIHHAGDSTQVTALNSPGLKRASGVPVHPHRHSQCGVCIWVNSKVSNPPSSCVLAAAPVITPFIDTSVAAYHFDSLALNTSRAPPQI